MVKTNKKPVKILLKIKKKFFNGILLFEMNPKMKQNAQEETREKKKEKRRSRNKNEQQYGLRRSRSSD